MTRKLEQTGLSSQWKDNEMKKLNGIFSIHGVIYGVDHNDTIQSLNLTNGQELHIKQIVSQIC